MDLHGRTVIITGAGNGLGRSHALAAAALGADVVVNDLGGSNVGLGSSTGAADGVVEEIRSRGGSAIANYESIAHDEGCRALAGAAMAEFGRVDAVVHNAAILPRKLIPELDDETLRAVMDTNLLGCFYLTKAVFPSMVGLGYGRFVFTSSAVGMWGGSPGSAHYAMSKAGLVGLCNAVAQEGAAHGIKANAVMPLARTRIFSSEPVPTQPPDEQERDHPAWVSPLVVYLASEACAGNGICYSAGMGRFARIFIGVTSGWYAPDGTAPTPNDIATNLARIEDRSEYDVPDGVRHEVELLLARHREAGVDEAER